MIANMSSSGSISIEKTFVLPRSGTLDVLAKQVLNEKVKV
jgi:hypothetical protein